MFSRRTKILAVLGTLLFMIAFNVSSMRFRSSADARFSEWLTGVRAELLPVADRPARMVPVRLRLFSADPALPIDWSLDLSASEDQPALRERALRILNLVEEANILTPQPATSTELPAGVLRLTIDDRGQHFEALLQASQLDVNLKARLLVKLFEVFASQSNAPVNQPS